MSGHSQPRRSSVREAVGVIESEESPDKEKPGTRDRLSAADSGDDLDEISEDAQSPDEAAEGARRRYLLRRFGAVQQASGDGGTIPPGCSPARFSSSSSLTSARCMR
jgi:hypothetical protein